MDQTQTPIFFFVGHPCMLFNIEIPDEQVNSNGPRAIGQPEILKDRAHPNREHRPVGAIAATVRHAWMLDT